jgi:hypothetical protein
LGFAQGPAAITLRRAGAMAQRFGDFLSGFAHITTPYVNYFIKPLPIFS